MRTIVRISLLVVSLVLWGTALFAVDKQETPKGADIPKSAVNSAKTVVLISPEFTINSARTAVLIMDYQNEIVSMLPENVQVSLLDRASTILKKARQAHLPIVYVVVRFRDGYPEINLHNKLFSSLKESGRLREGTSGSEINDRVAPQLEDIVIAKRRVGAFPNTELETILRAKNINTLVLFGIATSGVVLSTIRWAADMDYSLVVISDACADRDAEVNRVLMDKVFPWQATVVTTGEFLNAIESKDVK
jgi:nicotinamidase-related amidase